MSLDQRGRVAAEQLRQATSRSLDPDDMLVRLHRARTRRTAASAVAGLAAVVVAAVLVGATIVGNGASDGPPAHGDREAVRLSADFCRDDAVTCLGGRKARVNLKAPLTVDIPETFRPGARVTPPGGAEFYRADVERTGVTVARSAVPAQYSSGWEPDLAAGMTARSMAEWLAGRSFLTDTTVTRRTAGGRTAWEVTGSYRAGARLPATMNGGTKVAPTFFARGTRFASAPYLPGSYTLVDQPDGGVTVIWSWAFNLETPDIAGNQAMVDEILAGL